MKNYKHLKLPHRAVLIQGAPGWYGYDFKDKGYTALCLESLDWGYAGHQCVSDYGA